MPGAFLWDDRVAGAASLTSMAGTQVSTMPVSNLLDPQPRLRARWLGSIASVRVDFGTDTSVEAVALMSTSLDTDASVRWRLGPAEALVEATPLFDLRFDAGSITPPTGYNFRRPSTGWCFDATGSLAQIASDAPRFDRDPATLQCLGILLEEQRTNGIRNPRAEGAVAGTPGTAPTNWTVASGSGISTQIVGVGTESGIPYVDIRWFGTATGLVNCFCAFETPAGVAAAVGQAWSLSGFVRLIAGGLGTPVQQTQWGVTEFNAGGSSLVANAAVWTVTGAPLATQRKVFTTTTINAACAYVRPNFNVQYASWAMIDFTLRIGAPQLERGAFATSPILPTPGSPAAATRAADQQWLAGLAIDGTAGMSVLVDFTGATGGVGTTVPWSFTPASTAFLDSIYLAQSGVYANVGLTLLDSVHGNCPVQPSLAAPEGLAARAVATVGAAGELLACNAAMPITNTQAPTFAGILTTMGLGAASWGGAPGTATGQMRMRRIAFYTRQLTTGQARALAASGSSLDTTVLAHDSGTIATQTGDAAAGNVVLLRPSAATGRYLQIDVVSPSAAFIDLGRLVAGPLWRLTRAFAYGLQEGRLILDRRDRNTFTGAEFPVPALAIPRITRFTLPLLTAAEIKGQHRSMLRAMGAVGDALWIPETGLSQVELNTRSIWGAVAEAGAEALASRDSFPGSSRSFVITERV